MKTHKHPKLANGQPAISCFALSIEELVTRQNFAYERAKAQATAEQADDKEAQAIASMTLWHSDFPTGFFFYVCDAELFRLAADLPGELLVANGGRELDFWDYGYVADVLRERLAGTGIAKGDRPNLRRALAWAEEQGRGLRDYSQERYD